MFKLKLILSVLILSISLAPHFAQAATGADDTAFEQDHLLCDTYSAYINGLNKDISETEKKLELSKNDESQKKLLADQKQALQSTIEEATLTCGPIAN